MPKRIFITGGTGYLGSRIISLLLKSGNEVKALIRKGSEDKLPKGCIQLLAIHLPRMRLLRLSKAKVLLYNC